MAMVAKKNVEDLNVSGKRVIVRVDFNVPLDKKTGEITDDKRIKGALPTIKYLVDNNAKVILVSHLGRPKNGPEPAFSMKPAADRLAELIGKPVTLAADVIGEDATYSIKKTRIVGIQKRASGLFLSASLRFLHRIFRGHHEEVLSQRMIQTILPQDQRRACAVAGRSPLPP